MKALVYKNVNEISLEEIQAPQFPQTNWVMVEIYASGLCGSDIHKFFHQRPPPNYLTTTVLGHEIAGVVVEIGVGVNTINVGDRVAIEPLISCEKCKFCLDGKSQLCENLKSIGRSYSGGFTERILVPSKNVWKLPNNVSFSEGTQIDLVAVAVHALNICSPNSENWNCAVIGDGPLGLILAQVAKTFGANNIVMFAKHEYKRKIAEDLGLLSIIVKDDKQFELEYKNQFDIVFETVGGRQSGTINNGITITVPSGKLIILGVFDFGYSPAIEVRKAFYKEVSIIGINSYSKNHNQSDFKSALSLISNGLVNINKIISHKFKLSEYKEAFSIIRNKSNAVKIIFESNTILPIQ